MVTLHGIISPRDTTIEEALAIAGEMLEHGTFYDAAFVDSQQGLILFDPGLAYREDFAQDRTGFRLQTPRCGADGRDVLASGVILSLFGYGKPEKINEHIRTGGDSTHIHLTREMLSGRRR
jgi:hypothetical protein